MTSRILVLITFFSFFNGNSQETKKTPCAPGVNPIFSIDLDNDGYTIFDINHYLEFVLKPDLESFYNVSSSGYNFTFYNSNNVISPSPYTNIVFNEECNIKIEYSGSGSVFTTPPDACYEDAYLKFRGVQLVAVPFDGDVDNDGISNKNEDFNNNLNLMDDDDDNDGIINLLDPVTLSDSNYNYLKGRIYPNPVTNGLLNLEFNSLVDEVVLYDFTGKTILKKQSVSNNISLENYPKGAYLLKLRIGDKIRVEKIFIN